MASCKVETEGRLHVDGELVSFLKQLTDSRAMPSAGRELVSQAEASQDATFPLEIVGPEDEELERGMVLLTIGPISLEVCTEQLLRALRPFERGPR